jgi:hypothetical protein
VRPQPVFYLPRPPLPPMGHLWSRRRPRCPIPVPRPPAPRASLYLGAPRRTPSPESNSPKKNESDRGHVAWKSFRFKKGHPIARLITSSSSRTSPPPRCPASTMPFFFLHLRPVQPATRARGGAPTVGPPGSF